MDNIEELKALRLRLISINNVLNDTESLEQFDDIGNLNRSMFTQITYFLLKSIHKDMIKTLPWPLHNAKAHDLFIKELFKVIDSLRIQHPWANFPKFQKSHFYDPRPENDKVVTFLMELSYLTVYLITNSRPEDVNIIELQQKSTELDEKHKSLCSTLEALETKKRLLEDGTLEKLISIKKQELVDNGIINSIEDFSLDTLLNEKQKLHRILLPLVQKLEELRDNNF